MKKATIHDTSADTSFTSTDMATQIDSLLQQVAVGAISPDSAVRTITAMTRLAQAQDTVQGLHLDRQREWRTGLGEVIFAQGKSDEVLLAAVEGLSGGKQGEKVKDVLVSRVSPEQGTLLQKYFPVGLYMPQARLFAVGNVEHMAQAMQTPWSTQGDVLVISAGAADIPVALEAFGTLQFWHCSSGCITDVGIAGLHRLQPYLPALHAARLIIAVAGMEGALPGVIAGLVPTPVLAVPTSVGYGVGAHGLAALSTMLCTCVPGVSVLNIDNGFGAAAFAAKVIRKEKA